jgi:very-short-patch-repair endonuclease
LDSNIKAFVKSLRKRSTDAESLLWKHLRAKRLKGLKFRRQEPIGKYIADFVCYEKQIIIEVDGGQHSIDKDRDNERDIWFKGEGFKVLRFWNNEVLTDTEAVLTAIMISCLESPSPSSPPIDGGDLHTKV